MRQPIVEKKFEPHKELFIFIFIVVFKHRYENACKRAFLPPYYVII